MNNTKQVIDNHNKHILHLSHSPYMKNNKDGTRTNKTCNCRQKNNCRSTVTAFNLQSFIKPPSHGTTTTPLKHTLDSQKPTSKQDTEITPHHSAKHKNSTELSKHIWTLKNDNIDYSISWRVLSSNSPYNSSSKRCNLCLKEKFLIIYQPDLSSLNKHNELVSSCRHRNKALQCYS